MIIIQKKRIMYVCLMVFTSIFVCTLSVNRSQNTVQTVAIPVTNKVIVIDARTSVNQMNGAQSSSRNNRGSD